MCRRFNHRRIAGFAAEELQADEIRTFAGKKKTPSWVFVTIEVWSRLWPSTVTGRRSYRNTHALLRNDRIIKVERRALHGAAWRFEDALNNSEDSSTLKHVVHRAVESDHPAKLGIPFETNAFPRSLDGEAR